MITSSFLPSERYVCRVGLLERLALHTPYPAIAARISAIVRRLPRGQTTVIIDRTGAHAAYDMLVEKGLSPLGLTISGGDSVHWDGRCVTVPKMRLLTGLLSICYRGELEISQRLRDYVEFRRQLQNIGTMVTDSGTGETWRARRGHDDLVIAVSMAVWYLENPGPNMGLWEYYRRQAGAPLENYCVAVDFGQSASTTARSGPAVRRRALAERPRMSRRAQRRLRLQQSGAAQKIRGSSSGHDRAAPRCGTCSWRG